MELEREFARLERDLDLEPGQIARDLEPEAPPPGAPHLHDTDSAETGWCSGCGRADLAIDPEMGGWEPRS